MNIMLTLRGAVRSLSRRPGLCGVIVLLLSMGIASVTVMFSLFDSVLLRGLPYQDADRLVSVWGRPADPSHGGSPDSRWWTSYSDFADMRDAQTRFMDLAAYDAYNAVVRTSETRPRRLDAGRVSAGFFKLLGVSPVAGRVFTEQEDRWGGEPVVVLGSTFADELGVHGNEVGEATIDIDDVPHRVIGIMPVGLNLPRDVRFWLPVAQNMGMDNRGQHRLHVVGRLKPGVTVESAQAEMAAIAGRLADAYPDSNRNRTAWVEPLRESLVGSYRNVMRMLMAACALLLLVVAVNVAGLLVVRAANRRREMAIRRSLGASRRQLVGQLLAESSILGGVGAAIGLLLAWGALGSAPAWLPADLPLAGVAGLNATVLAFALVTAIGTSVAFGLIPAWRGARTSGAADLRTGATQAGTRRSRLGLGGSLLVVQVALAFALVAGAALLARTALHLLTEPLGFDARGRVAFRIFLPAERYHPMNQPRKVNAYYRQLLDGVRALPGVVHASVAGIQPLEPNWTTSFWIEGREPPASGVLPEARFRPVGPDYFKTAGIPLLSGRAITGQDDFQSAGVVVINRAFAREYFGDEDPVGQYLTKQSWWKERDSQRWRIVGVAGDVKFDGPGSPAAPAFYFSQAQWPIEDRFLVVDAGSSAAALVRPIQHVIWSIDDSVPADNITFMESARTALLRDRLLATSLLGAFAALVLALAVTGLYALLSFAVGAERRHIGVRLAVGATPRSVLSRYLKRGLWLVTAGIAAGVVLFLAARALLDAVNATLGPAGPVMVAFSAAVFLIAGLLGALVPARRAARLAPMTVLRDE